MKSYTISANNTYSKLCLENSINDFQQLEAWLRCLPYGRTSNRTDLSLLFAQNKGTCSSKHALIKAIADENNYPEFQLIIGIYQMNQGNTPGIKDALDNFEMDYLPEAHTYIRLLGDTIDVTTPASDFSKLSSSVMKELVIVPSQVGQFKIDYHKSFLKQWIIDHNLQSSFEHIWSTREQCIKNLSL